MKSKSEIVKEFIEHILLVGSELASKNYMKIVLSSTLNKEKKGYPFLDYITLSGDNIFIDQKIEPYSNKEISEALNKIFDSIFVETSRELVRQKISEELLTKFRSFGIKL